jgi:hypothetical protein
LKCTVLPRLERSAGSVVYGRIFSPPNLGKKDCGEALGCRGFIGAPLAILTEPYNIYRVRKDGTPMPAPAGDGQ